MSEEKKFVRYENVERAREVALLEKGFIEHSIEHDKRVIPRAWDLYDNARSQVEADQGDLEGLPEVSELKLKLEQRRLK